MNFKPQSENYYSRLDLEENCSSDDVKKNFFKAVKLYPPEKNPENYNLIREAYDTLKNEHSRNEYDTMNKYGEAIQEIEEKIKIAKENSNREKHIKLLKKLIVLAPNISIYRNDLGLQYLALEEAKKAKKQFSKAININPDNIVYILNLAHSNEQLGEKTEAERNFKKAWELDPEDYAAPRALASFYFDNDNKEIAYEVLEKAIIADDIVDFQDFFCIFDKIQYMVIEKKIDKLEDELKRIKDISKNQEERQFSSFLLTNSALELAKYGIYDVAYEFAEVVISITMNSEIKDNLKSLQEFINLDKNESIEIISKSFVLFYSSRYFDIISETEFNKDKNRIFDTFKSISTTAPKNKEVSNGLKLIRKEYPLLYRINQNFYDQFIDLKAVSFYDECPYCGENVTVNFSEYLYNGGGTSKYTCPHCNNTIKFDGKNYYTKGDCYITTATCYALKKNEGCSELNTFRKFRDNWLMKQEYGKSLIKEYYRIAPSIVKSINKLHNSKEIFLNIWNDYLIFCYELLLEKQYNEARDKYIEMVSDLKDNYL